VNAGSEDREGEGPREAKTQESQGPRTGEIRDAAPQPAGGSKPLRRGRDALRGAARR
jgi:hypothetical protein